MVPPIPIAISAQMVRANDRGKETFLFIGDPEGGA